MSKRVDITGQRFGRLIAIKWLNYNNGESIWECLCDCGQKPYISYQKMVTGNTTSCGCYRREVTARNAAKRRRKVFNLKDPKLGKKLTYYIRNAKRRGHKWQLKPTEFEHILDNTCFYCGSNAKIGIDRVNCTKGYKKDNVVPCCTNCNQAKNDKTVQEFATWLENIYAYYKKIGWNK